MLIQPNLRSACALFALLCAATTSQAQNLVNDGDFNLTTAGTNAQVGTYTDLTAWSLPAGSDAFLLSGVAAQAVGSYGDDFYLWNGSNGGSSAVTNSPTGGNFYASDPAFDNLGPLTQTLSGLAAGTYQVSFDWAAAQQYSFTGDNTESWFVQLGAAPAQSTITVNNPSQGFTGWMHVTMNFTVGAGDTVLSFLAGGGDASSPPFALLDGVSVTAVPEPSTLGLMPLGLLGFMALGAVQRQLRTNKQG